MNSNNTSFSNILESLLEGHDLSEEQSSVLMHSWLNEDFQPVQTGALLAAFRSKGVNGNELSGMAKVLQNACSMPIQPPDYFLVDTCGTGGDGANTFNISTAVAFVSAACGVKIAKHGNRSASGSVGSADVLESLGIPLNAPLEKVVTALEKTNVTFLFAPAWHSSLINLAPLRKSLGIRTVFNLLGPLVNPLKPQGQVLGVAKSDLLDPMANALLGLGLDRAIVVFGSGGLDEASLEGANQFRFISNGEIKSDIISPSDLGLDTFTIKSLEGSDIKTNANILESLLRGRGEKSHRQVVALNSALVLWVAGIEKDLSLGVSKALKCLDSDTPWAVFNQLKSHLSI